jgi:hypothetical protein
MDSTGGDTVVEPKEKLPFVKNGETPPELSQTRLNNTETGPFTGTW